MDRRGIEGGVKGLAGGGTGVRRSEVGDARQAERFAWLSEWWRLSRAEA